MYQNEGEKVKEKKGTDKQFARLNSNPQFKECKLNFSIFSINGGF